MEAPISVPATAPMAPPTMALRASLPPASVPTAAPPRPPTTAPLSALVQPASAATVATAKITFLIQSLSSIDVPASPLNTGAGTIASKKIEGPEGSLGLFGCDFDATVTRAEPLAGNGRAAI